MIKKNKPLVTVYMPMYNTGKYVAAAIESILNQTHRHFEFIIIDDCSTDRSYQIAKKYAKVDKRIRLFKNAQNLGVSATSNFAVSISKGKYITRMDSDDLAPVYRLERQVAYLTAHPQTIAVGGQCVIIDKRGNFIGTKNFPLYPKEITDMLFWAMPIQQGTMMINKSLLPTDFYWYQPNLSSAEEINLIFRLTRFGNIANISDTLLFYRHLNTSLSHLNPKKTFALTLNSRLEALRLGFKPSLKAIGINVVQIFIIALLPNSIINQLWYYIRGVKQISYGYQIESIIN